MRGLDDLGDVEGKRVLVRVDFNVPLDEGRITDDARIRAALPTLEELREKGARLLLAAHLGRPKDREPEFSLRPVAERLSDLLGEDVQLADGLDAVVAGAVDLDDVHVLAHGDGAADVAGAAGVDGGAPDAVEAPGEDAGHRRLADAPGSREQVGVGHAAVLDRILQRLRDVLLADDFAERLRPKSPREHRVMSRFGFRRHAAVVRGAEDPKGVPAKKEF